MTHQTSSPSKSAHASRFDPRRLALALLLTLVPLLAVVARPLGGGTALAAAAAVAVTPGTAVGPLATRLSTNLVYPGVVAGLPAGPARLAALAPPLLRLHAGTDGTWPGGPAPALPAGLRQGDWDFSSLDQLVGTARASGGRPLLNIRYAPNWMWTCAAYWSDTPQGVGTLADPSFATFAAYLARLVAYYNTGRMVTEAGATVANPAGTANRIDAWELWNEPDLANETPCHPADWGPALTPAQYLRMWNAAAPAMRAVDPTITLVGPATANAATGQDPEYVPTLLAGATIPPDAISFHGYGGWENSQGDEELFEGGNQTDGLAAIVSGLAQVRAWAGELPVWITEINVNAAWDDDPTGRPWGAYGVAWGATAFRRLALGGAGILHWYQFSEGAQFAMLDSSTGKIYLPYWTMMVLSQAFPAGSTIVGSTSTLGEVESLAVRRPDGSLGVLVVNRQVDSASAVGGPGKPATVTVDLGLTPAAVRLRQLDATTSAASGPATQTLAAQRTVQLNFPGYGLAVLDVDVSGGANPNPSPSAVPSTGTCGQRFGDVPGGNPACTAIEALAQRGIINGCDQAASPPLFCPDDTTLREQLAALIVRAMPGWQDETWPNTFTDQTADSELMRRVGTLQHYGVADGYNDCAAQGKASPCYGPLDPVLKAQAISFVTRAMVAKGYWAQQPIDTTLYAGALLGTGHEQDASTYWYYTRAHGGVPDYPEGGDFPLSESAQRGWFARLLWTAIQGTPAAP